MHSPLVISQTDPRPLYAQVKDQIRHRIAIGELRPGEEIPSIRALAAQIRVSVITIKRAYLELELEGVIQTRQGRGSFVAESPPLDHSAHERELADQLAAVARTAVLLGLDDEALVARLLEARRLLRKPSP